LAYLTAFLNSKLFRFAFKDYFPELLGETRELSKVFFERITVLPVDEATNSIFEKWINDIVLLKKEHKPTIQIEESIERKLKEIYALTDTEAGLLGLSKTIAVEGFPEINAISDSVNS